MNSRAVTYLSLSEDDLSGRVMNAGRREGRRDVRSRSVVLWDRLLAHHGPGQCFPGFSVAIPVMFFPPRLQTASGEAPVSS